MPHKDETFIGHAQPIDPTGPRPTDREIVWTLQRLVHIADDRAAGLCAAADDGRACIARILKAVEARKDRKCRRSPSK